MNILLHGAINGSNFGDCIFADLFYNSIKYAFPNDNVFFVETFPFGISEFLCKKLNYNKGGVDINDMDVLVYISGGYFGEGKKNILQSIRRYFRYFKIANYFIKNKKVICVVGLEIGPIHFKFLQNVILKILQSSKLIIVRNKESQDYCVKLGINSALLSSDTALAIKNYNYYLTKVSKNIDSLFACTKKAIFLHIQPNDKIDDLFVTKVVNPLINFIKSNNEYYIIFGSDGVEKKDFKANKIQKLFSSNKVYAEHFIYESYWDLCYLLSKVEIVITRRLHVGIIGCLYKKVVFSIPIHEYKTERFYRQIGYESHCYAYHKLTPEIMTDFLINHNSEHAIITNEIINAGTNNLTNLVNTLKALK